MDIFNVVLIDDDENQIEYLSTIFDTIDIDGLTIFSTSSVEKAIDKIEDDNINLVLTDYVMPEMNGFDVLKKVKEINPLIDVVIITGHADTKSAVEIMKYGAYDYLIKPVRSDTLSSLLWRVKEKQGLVRENAALKQEIREQFRFDSIISQSRKMEQVLTTIRKSAKSNVSVLIRGESGTGKELLAKAVHYSSLRKDKPFVTVNVSALSESLIESELFGHKRGAFTGATNDHIGRFQRANKGTLFIDEVGDIPPSIQVKLLRVLQFGQIEPVGSAQPITVDVRVIAATSRDIEKMIKEEKFRLDFYYRLNVVTIPVPALRERKEDIPLLVDYLIPYYAKQHHRKVKGISRDALELLMRYDFPGNVRELENILQRAIVLCNRQYIEQEDLPELFQSKEHHSTNPIDTPLHGNYEEKMNQFEASLIIEALTSSNGNKSAAARLLGIGERRLRYRMEKLDIKESDTEEAV